MWLKNAAPADIARSPILSARVQGVREHRSSSKREATRRLAVTPTLFGEDRQPDKPYLGIPEVSSENRPYVPIAFVPADVIATNKVIVVPDADLFLFGILTSAMHMAWMRAVGGRLKSDYQYSPGLVYNTFPFPTADGERRKRVEDAAQTVLDRRSEHPGAALSLLYDPVTMPPALGQAHAALDAVVDALYGRRKVRSDLDRQSVLFERYAEVASPLARV